MVVILNTSNKVRRCGDLAQLIRELIVRESFKLPTVKATLAKLSGVRYFCKLDANSGFYQIKLDRNFALLMTLSVPW